MATFHGESNQWRPFIYQFSQTAKTFRWSRKHWLEKLLACLSDKAMEYTHTLSSPVRHNYKDLKSALAKRYGQKDPSIYARRQLPTLKQSEQETVEDFADKVLRLVLDGFPRASNDIIQQLAIEIFLHGCREKTTAYAASEKEPRTLQKALKYVKNSTQNLKYMGKPSYASRQVSFDLGTANSIETEATVRSTSQANGHNKTEITKPASQIDARELAKEISEQLSLSLPKLISSQCGQQSRSQSPKKENITCYACNRKGHYSNECPEKRSKEPLRTTTPSSPRRGGSCFSCGSFEHFQRECPRKERSPSSEGRHDNSPLKA